MIKFEKSRDNYSNYVNLVDILREQRKVYLGTLESGEHIVIEYAMEKENISPTGNTVTTQLTQENQFTNQSQQTQLVPSTSQLKQTTDQSKQTESVSKKSQSQRITEQSEQTQSASTPSQHVRNRILDCLAQLFKNHELRELSFRLNITENVQKDREVDTAMEIIEYCERHYGRDAATYEKIISCMKIKRNPNLIDKYISPQI